MNLYGTVQINQVFLSCPVCGGMVEDTLDFSLSIKVLEHNEDDVFVCDCGQSVKLPPEVWTKL